MVNVLWGEKGEVDVRPVGHNLFIIQFVDSDIRDKVIENGPWHIQNKPLIVRKWEPGMRSLEFNMAKLPIWIQLENIPLELFTQAGISYIASALGNPLYMDRITASQKRLAFAKVCVEIEASKEIPSSIGVALRNGIVQVNVITPWLPMKCSTCCVFGHGDKFCPQKTESVPEKVWMPKKVEKEGKDAGVEKGSRIEKDTQQNEDKGKRQMQEVESSSSMKAGSENRFTILESVMEKDEEVATPKQDAPTEANISVETRKVRAAAAGVANLMRTLRARKKGPTDKVKSKKVGSAAKGGQVSSHS